MRRDGFDFILKIIFEIVHESMKEKKAQFFQRVNVKEKTFGLVKLHYFDRF